MTAAARTDRSTLWVTLVLAGLVLAAFYPLLTAEYGSSDDYTFFQAIRLEADPGLVSVVSSGRPVLAWLYTRFVERLGHFDELRWLRLTYLVLLTLAALTTWAIARNAGLEPLAAVTLAALSAIGPATVDLGALTPSFVVPLGWVLTGLAMLVWWRPGPDRDGPRPVRPRSGLGRHAGAVALLVLALAIYQTSAFMWVFLLAVAVLTPRPARLAGLGHLLHGLALFVVAMAVYWLAVLVGYNRWLGLVATDRAELTHELPLKLLWFVALPLRDALDLFAIFTHDAVLDHRGLIFSRPPGWLGRLGGHVVGDPAYWLAAVVGLAMVAGLLAHFQGRLRLRLLLAATALALLPIAYSLNIAIASIWSPYRTQLPLYGLICLYLVLGLRAWLGKRSRRLLAAVLLGWLAATVASVAWINRAFVVAPLACEWRDLLAELRRTAAARRLLVVPARLEDSAAPAVRYEIGRPASAAPWAPPSMVAVGRHELGLPPTLEVRVADGWPVDAPVPEGWAVIRLGCRRPAGGDGG